MAVGKTNAQSAVPGDYVEKTGDTMTGLLQFENTSSSWPSTYPVLKAIGDNDKEFSFNFTDNGTNMDIGYDWNNGDGAGIGLRSIEHTSQPGYFNIYARSGNTATSLKGTPDGTLTWDNRRVPTAITYTSASFSSLSQTFNVTGCTANMVVAEYTLSNPAAQTSDWTITTAAGQVTVAGSISGSTTLTLILIEV